MLFSRLYNVYHNTLLMYRYVFCQKLLNKNNYCSIMYIFCNFLTLTVAIFKWCANFRKYIFSVILVAIGNLANVGFPSLSGGTNKLLPL